MTRGRRARSAFECDGLPSPYGGAGLPAVAILRTPSVFVRIGDNVAQGRFRVVKFEDKRTGGNVDASELTLRDNVTNAEILLVFNQAKAPGAPVAVFEFGGPASRSELHVTAGSEFTLPPQKGRRYKLLEVSEDSATVQTPEGEKVVVRRK